MMNISRDPASEGLSIEERAPADGTTSPSPEPDEIEEETEFERCAAKALPRGAPALGRRPLFRS
jgi:hypothetical protein